MPPENIIVKASVVTVYLGPIGFRHYARQFLDASLTSLPSDGFSPVPYYLVCRSLELSIKAFLLARGVPEKSLRSHKLGHDLLKCLECAKSQDLSDVITVTQKQVGELKKANVYYAKKGFEYFQVGNAVTAYKDLPNLDVLQRFAQQILESIEDTCKKAV